MYKLIVNNTDIINCSNTISWNNDSDSLGTQLSFDSIKEIATGNVVQLFNNDSEIFRGIALKPTQKRWTWSYTCQDYSFYLKNSKIPIKQFNKITASEAIRSLASESYLTVNIDDIPTVIDQYYTNTTRSDIIDDILKQASIDQGTTYFKEIQGNILYIYNIADMKISPTIILPKDISIEMSMENMKNSITVISGSNDSTVIQATAEDTSQQWFYGVLSDVQTVDDKNIAQAQNIANNALLENNKVSYQSTFEVVAVSGGDTIKANRLIYIHAGNRLNAYYKIKNAQHTLNKGLHKVNITITW
ncbi:MULTISPECIES: hypothetical protein [unclassified Clostridium]|uniref:XkdQ/YqbQ family protein n=1 Tax=unclassified Clostridium TaxID=2614128 RepID=UPI000297BF3B|nr:MULTISPECIES: hypothetical protein [unclassified Clostridium]EKQ51392.1 MAG: hypothetical protein A370_04919 [Clostridium sp. Maddingley MBC34-26]